MLTPLTCPICRKQLAHNAGMESATFPFCSVRCKQVDLGRWLNGKYAIIEPLTGSADDLSEQASPHVDLEFDAES